MKEEKTIKKESKKENILVKLLKIQSELKVPKNQFNDYGGYKFRSNEDILELAKPIAHKYKCVILQSDEIQNIGERYYVKATTSIVDVETGEMLSNTASAREEESRKGMGQDQLTGACSSYARKYSANGLFAIDDEKDSDTTNKHEKEIIKATEKQIEYIKKIIPEEKMPDLFNYYKISKLEDLPIEKAKELIARKSVSNENIK